MGRGRDRCGRGSFNLRSQSRVLRRRTFELRYGAATTIASSTNTTIATLVSTPTSQFLDLRCSWWSCLPSAPPQPLQFHDHILDVVITNFSTQSCSLIARLDRSLASPVCPAHWQLSFDPMKLPIHRSYDLFLSCTYLMCFCPSLLNLHSMLIIVITLLCTLQLNALLISADLLGKTQTWLSAPLYLLCTCTWTVAEEIQNPLSDLTLNSWLLATSGSLELSGNQAIFLHIHSCMKTMSHLFLSL